MCSALTGQDFLHMVMWAILKNLKFQDFWINFCSMLKACIDKVSWDYISLLGFIILRKMNRIASNKGKLRNSPFRDRYFDCPTVHCLKFKPTKC